MPDRPMPLEPLLAFAVRDPRWDRSHPAAADLELLLGGAPGVAGVASDADTRVWIVFSGAPPHVRAAAQRLYAGPLPNGISRVRLR
jgi:hypothetical protein